MSRPLSVFFVYVWPEPRSSAAGVRTLELIQALQEAGWEVAVVSPSRESGHRAALEARGVATFSCDPNISEESAPLSALSPRLVLFDRFMMEEQFGWRVSQLWPGALRLVDTIDLHSVRRARERLARARAGTPDWSALVHLKPEEMGEDLLRELSSLYRSDGAIVVSDWERDFLVEKLGFPAGRVLLLPLEGHASPAPANFTDRVGFASLGNFRHTPNRDGVDWLLAELWPRLRAALPRAELHLYGAYPPAEISRHRGKDGIFAQGHVADHRAALSRHRVLLAPLRYGAGIKGKVLEAWATGTPVLGSPIAFEGMGEAGARFPDPDTFVREAVELHENEARWQQERERNLAHLERHFHSEELRARFHLFVNGSLERLSEIRASNLVGQMLRHHRANSTKYFSRWIEAKNK